MPKPVTVRRADLDNQHDCRAIVEMLVMYAEDPMSGIDGLPQPTREQLGARLREQPGTVALLAEIDQRAVGVAIAFTGFSTFAARPLLNLHDLAVRPECRGQGVGRRLIEAIERRARETGCCGLTLEVRGDNRAAVELYRSSGFSGPDRVEPVESWGFWKKMLD